MWNMQIKKDSFSSPGSSDAPKNVNDTKNCLATKFANKSPCIWRFHGPFKAVDSHYTTSDE